LCGSLQWTESVTLLQLSAQQYTFELKSNRSNHTDKCRNAKPAQRLSTSVRIAVKSAAADLGVTTSSLASRHQTPVDPSQRISPALLSLAAGVDYKVTENMIYGERARKRFHLPPFEAVHKFVLAELTAAEANNTLETLNIVAYHPALDISSKCWPQGGYYVLVEMPNARELFETHGERNGVFYDDKVKVRNTSLYKNYVTCGSGDDDFGQFVDTLHIVSIRCR